MAEKDKDVELVPETPQEEAEAIDEEYYSEEPDLDQGWEAEQGDEELVETDPEPEPEPAEVPLDQEAEFTNEHFAYGQTLGLSPEQVRAFGNPQAFETVVSSITENTGGDPARAAVQQQVAGQQQ